ncbi:hypothetical protein BDK92_0634 [Micromonospora pisi]|uniref:Uncharacterized protein n=1 Tax=Micromonospora pisi TaxID=589240 RepID=A0A495JEB5_9ACTN|nr:hypothetical protein BDK92_0634 [Micromonospora pisi]
MKDPLPIHHGPGSGVDATWHEPRHVPAENPEAAISPISLARPSPVRVGRSGAPRKSTEEILG